MIDFNKWEELREKREELMFRLTMHYYRGEEQKRKIINEIDKINEALNN